NGRRARGRDGLVECSPDHVCFSWAEDRDDEFWHSEKTRHGQSDGGRRNFFEALEPALGGLLATARLVEMHDLDVERVVKIGLGRIVEGEMAVLADADQAKLRIRGA